MLFFTQKALDVLTWEVYAGEGESSFTHFDDDGTTFAFEQGKYAATRLNCVFKGKKMSLAIETLHNGTPELTSKRTNEYTIFGLPKGVKVVK